MSPERGPARRRLRIGLEMWLALSVVGVGIVVIPDESPRLFSLSETHGLSLVDSVGIVVLAVGWVSYLVPLWRHRASLTRPRRWGFGAALGAVVVAWSVVTDTGFWWVLGVLILVWAQIAPGLYLLKEAKCDRE